MVSPLLNALGRHRRKPSRKGVPPEIRMRADAAHLGAGPKAHAFARHGGQLASHADSEEAALAWVRGRKGPGSVNGARASISAAMNPKHPQLSPQLSDALHRVTNRGLSTAARIGHVALLLVALGMGIAVASLLATEPSLPSRTIAAFGGMLVIAATWSIYAVWVLRYRRALMVQHRLIAGRIAVVFCLAFSAAALAAGVAAKSAAGFLAAATGAVLLIGAMAVLRRAHLARDELQRRRERLEAEVGRR